MFNLEQAIADWRRQMTASGIGSPDVLDELEAHLREDVERQVRSGFAAQNAFEAAVQRIGWPARLRDEFAKAGVTGARRQKWKAALLRFIGVPSHPRPLALTTGAGEILDCGGREARGFQHDFIGTEHVLLGLLEAKTGVVPGVLQRMGVDPKTVRDEIGKIVGPGRAQGACPAPPYTPRVKKALELAGAEARALNRTQVDGEHIFLGLLREGSGVAAMVLKSLGVNTQTAREEVIRELGRQPGATES
jgi:hypothetical protein